MSIDPSGVKYVMNPYDEYALEQALLLKDEAGEGTVTVVSLGPEDARDTLRSALAMGADEAVLLIADAPSDGLVVARALAEAIRGREYDLILFGKQAIDGDNMQVPAMVAEILGHPCATVVTALELDGSSGSARREVEGGHELVEFDLPAVIAAQKGLNKPRHPSVKGIMMAKKKPLEQRAPAEAENGSAILSVAAPAARAGVRMLGDGVDAVPELVRILRDDVGVL